MNKFQKVHFRSVDEFLDFLPDDQLKVVEVLRRLVLDAIPEVKEKLSYNVPFYSQHKNICFIWPSAVPWGGIKEGVNLGFIQGTLIEDEDYLDKGMRKFVKVRNFVAPSEIDYDRVRSLLFQAALIDEEFRKRKR